MEDLSGVKALAFDLFGTILDLGGSLEPFIAEFFKAKKIPLAASLFWTQWRARQRLEQFQDTILMLGHSGYLETSRRALVYVMRLNSIPFGPKDIGTLMEAWQFLSPFPDVRSALKKLQRRYTLCALSNGEPDFLEHLVKNRILWKFDHVISVDLVGSFKPHPAVYRRAARLLQLEVCECMMVSSNSFDVVGAKACGFKGGYVNRYGLPYEDTVYQADRTVPDFKRLADALLK
ncbi:MAG: haloacid dehalogenase type II [Desulfobacterales bacterium]|jgi:2-haloacid dehalogenase|nr:haloacid dehalogenase type II [Desulfobacterales bacterium]